MNNDFFILIKERFADIALKFNFNFQNYTNSGIGCVEMKNFHCIVTFTIRFGETGCTIQRNSNCAKYHVYQIYYLLYPHESDLDHDSCDMHDDIELYHKMLQRLGAIFSGDFSWTKKMDEYTFKLNNDIEFIMKNFDPYHPMRLKLSKGDVSWQEDLKNLRNSM